MSKVLKITGSTISIGLDDGTLTQVRAEDLNFVPQIGDKVEIFQNETETLVTRVEPDQPASLPVNGGININLTSPPPPQYIANSKRAVSKVAYCLLAFFLGGLGIHKFYAGKTGIGVLYLLFCWTAIPLIISFVEFIIALCQTADSNGMILV